ncbi:MAG: NAD(P)/FAD-dependent oxidoreductase [Proteobacteria bacterium]|nr:NAD(P)/FAD-dependent oxidoreductase [Pseudomonadota bacterium]
MDHVDTCIIGAGVVGLAIGRRLASPQSDLLVLDCQEQYGQGISSRNSEVVHAGIYYLSGSLKATLCVTGNRQLYDYCANRHVAVRRCGKLIVATATEEESALEEILEKARLNGVDDLEYWSRQMIGEREPQVSATLGLFSPSTGIVSTHALMTAYLADIEYQGGNFVGGTQVTSVEIKRNRFVLQCRVQGEAYEFSCKVLVNSAGLGAQKLAAVIEGMNRKMIPQLHYCKGSYFTLASPSPFNHLIYPVPDKFETGLGIHATIDLGGQVKFGPDTEYIETEDYSVSMDRLDDYYEAVRRYYPGLADDKLIPGYVGIRPKLQGPGDPPADFVIQGENVHGIAGLVQLFGIESPGLTSSMAIADYVADLVNV